MVRKIITTVLIVVIIAAVVVYVLSARQSAARAESTYRVGTVVRSTIDDKVSTTGTLKAQNSLSQYLDSGLISRVNFKIGDIVTIEDELCEMQVSSALTGIALIKIKAEAEGTLTQVNVREGQIYNGLTPAFAIEDLSSQKVEVRLSKNDSYKIQIGQSAIVKVNDREYAGILDTVSPTATQVQTIQGVESSLVVDIKLNDTIPDVKIGFDVDCEILLEQLVDVLVVPLQSVQTSADASTHVFIVQDNKAKERQIKLGLVSGSYIQILEGVSEGDRIILNPKTTLKDGDNIIEEK